MYLCVYQGRSRQTLAIVLCICVLSHVDLNRYLVYLSVFPCRSKHVLGLANPVYLCVFSRVDLDLCLVYLCVFPM